MEYTVLKTLPALVVAWKPKKVATASVKMAAGGQGQWEGVQDVLEHYPDLSLGVSLPHTFVQSGSPEAAGAQPSAAVTLTSLFSQC